MGVWKLDGGPLFVFTSGSGATFLDGDRVGILRNLNRVPNGTTLGFWATYESPFACTDTDGSLIGRPVPNASELVKRVGKAFQGIFRYTFGGRTDKDGYPLEATVFMQDSKPSAANDQRMKFVGPLDAVSIEGAYSGDHVTVELNVNGKKIEGRMESYGREYAVKGEARYGMVRCLLFNPGNGKSAGSCWFAWDPTSVTLASIGAGKKPPTDRVLAWINSTEDKQRPAIMRRLNRQ